MGLETQNTQVVRDAYAAFLSRNLEALPRYIRRAHRLEAGDRSCPWTCRRPANGTAPPRSPSSSDWSRKPRISRGSSRSSSSRRVTGRHARAFHGEDADRLDRSTPDFVMVFTLRAWKNHGIPGIPRQRRPQCGVRSGVGVGLGVVLGSPARDGFRGGRSEGLGRPRLSLAFPPGWRRRNCAQPGEANHYPGRHPPRPDHSPFPGRLHPSRGAHATSLVQLPSWSSSVPSPVRRGNPSAAGADGDTSVPGRSDGRTWIRRLAQPKVPHRGVEGHVRPLPEPVSVRPREPLDQSLRRWRG